MPGSSANPATALQPKPASSTPDGKGLGVVAAVVGPGLRAGMALG
jgi:hypothetical protein